MNLIWKMPIKSWCDDIEADVMAMKGIVYDRWSKIARGKHKGRYDLGEAPAAYKDIDYVIESQLDRLLRNANLSNFCVGK